MLEQMIVERFISSTDAEKVKILSLLPEEMLAVGSEIYANLGGSIPVWVQYLKCVGAKGAQMLPPEVQKERLVSLLAYDSGTSTIATLLEAGLFVDEALAVLDKRLHNPDADKQGISWYTEGLRKIRERALPILLVAFKDEDAERLNRAFYAFSIDTWKDKKAIAQLSEAVKSVLERSTDQFVSEHCLDVLILTDPDSLLRFAMNIMESIGDVAFREHNVFSAGRKVLAAYLRSTSVNLKKEFIRTSIAHRMPWFDCDTGLTVNLLNHAGYEVLKDAFRSTTTESRTKIGNHFGTMHKTSLELPGIRQEIVTTTRIVSELLEEGIPVDSLLGFLVKAQNVIAEDDYVTLMITIARRGGTVNQLSEHHSYEKCTPEQVVSYMERLSGMAKTDAAIVILRKLAALDDGYNTHNRALSEALDCIVTAYIQPGIPISMESYHRLWEVPIVFWYNYLTTILDQAIPYWAIRFAIQALAKVDRDYGHAVATIIRFMLSDDNDVRSCIYDFFHWDEFDTGLGE